MMDSTYLEATAEAAPLSEAGEGQVQGDYPWLGGIEPTAMSYPGLAVSPYVAASPVSVPRVVDGESAANLLCQQTPLHSPETPLLDQPLFPSPMGDFAYLDQPYGDFLPVSYPIGGVSQSLFPFRLGHGGSTALSDRYDFTSATSAGLYSSVGAWPTQASPTSFLPTPPTADDLSQDSAPEDDDGSSDEEPRKRRRSASAAKSKKRPRTQLRTASRAPKKRPNILPQRPTETVEDVKARAAHNQVEQQYRKRLNLHFERLLSVLPAPGSSVIGGGRRDGIGERRVSKAEVLDLATERIQVLERDMARLERERRELRVRLGGCVM